MGVCAIENSEDINSDNDTTNHNFQKIEGSWKGVTAYEQHELDDSNDTTPDVNALQ